MNSAIFVFLALIVVLGGLALWQGQLVEGLRSAGSNLWQFAPILLLAFVVMGLVDVLIPEGFVERWLSDEAGWKGVGLAWIAGIATPGGSIIGLPIAAALYREGVGVAVLVTYLTSLALLSIIRLPLEAGFLGWGLAAARYGASLLLPLLAGALVMLVSRG